MFASEYGYTTKEFLSLTMRQVYELLECIQVRKHNEYAAMAALQGRKVKLRDVKRKHVEASEVDKDLIMQITKKATQRKAQERWLKTP